MQVYEYSKVLSIFVHEELELWLNTNSNEIFVNENVEMTLLIYNQGVRDVTISYDLLLDDSSKNITISSKTNIYIPLSEKFMDSINYSFEQTGRQTLYLKVMVNETEETKYEFISIPVFDAPLSSNNSTSVPFITETTEEALSSYNVWFILIVFFLYIKFLGKRK